MSGMDLGNHINPKVWLLEPFFTEIHLQYSNKSVISDSKRERHKKHKSKKDN